MEIKRFVAEDKGNFELKKFTPCTYVRQKSDSSLNKENSTDQSTTSDELILISHAHEKHFDGQHSDSFSNVVSSGKRNQFSEKFYGPKLFKKNEYLPSHSKQSAPAPLIDNNLSSKERECKTNKNNLSHFNHLEQNQLNSLLLLATNVPKEETPIWKSPKNQKPFVFRSFKAPKTKKEKNEQENTETFNSFQIDVEELKLSLPDFYDIYKKPEKQWCSVKFQPNTKHECVGNGEVKKYVLKFSIAFFMYSYFGLQYELWNT